MQVVILCGGQGTRIRDVADDVPKPMIPVGDRPILWHIMKSYAHFGFKDFILCLGYKGWTIKRYFLDYHLANCDFSCRLGAPEELTLNGRFAEEDWHVTLAETGLDAMTGCRVKRIERYVKGDDFLLTYGDGLADINLRHLVDFHRGHGKIGTVTAVRPPGRFGEIDLDGHHVSEFAEKPLLSRGRISGGFFVFQRRIFDRLHDDPGLVFEQAPLIQLARDGQLMAHLHNGFWQPMDNSRDYKYLNDLWSQGNAPWKTWETPRLRAAA
ncbi:MAG TPA: glucose-1-phosphate cytidylyltransferase [Gemmataceae bacterium]|jgi:glucose-1-phosphate cytidylyltransferase|nr:glucose-1-phosphate cytidylyltransferase [Gemmataceae bacterium]